MQTHSIFLCILLNFFVECNIIIRVYNFTIIIPINYKETDKMNLNIVCIPGDGIGPEIVAEAKRVLNKIAEKYNHSISYNDILMGGASIDACG